MNPEPSTDALLQQIDTYWAIAEPFALGLLTVVVALVAGWIASNWANRAVLGATERAGLDVALGRFLGALARYTVLAAAVIAALGSAGIETTSVVAILGSAGIAVGLALQGSLSHFASGVMILIFRPFSIGDFINTGGHTGTVHDIGLFATTLRTPDNQTIIVPNGAITGNTIVNFGAAGTRRIAVPFGVAYGVAVQDAKDAALAAIATVDGVLDEPAPAVAFVSMSASSIDFSAMAWCAAADYLPVMDAIRTAIYHELEARDIEIPFDQIVVHNAEQPTS